MQNEKTNRTTNLSKIHKHNWKAISRIYVQVPKYAEFDYWNCFLADSLYYLNTIFFTLYFYLSENMKHMYLRLYEVQRQNRLCWLRMLLPTAAQLLPTSVQTTLKNLFMKEFCELQLVNSNTCFGKNQLFQLKLSSSLRTLNQLRCDRYHLAGYYCSSARVFHLH